MRNVTIRHEVLTADSVSLHSFIHQLISPMHHTDDSIDASNFQPMNRIKQHLGESYICLHQRDVSFW